jgi:hypothetical protein
MLTITYAEFQANLHHYLEQAFREKTMIKVKDGARSFVLLGESWRPPASDNIANIGQITFQSQRPLRRGLSPLRSSLRPPLRQPLRRPLRQPRPVLTRRPVAARWES